MTQLPYVNRKIRIVLADDHVILREGLKLLLDAQEDMSVVGEAADGETACRMCTSLHPDVLVTDLSMPMLNGVATTERLRRDCPDIKILILTVHEEQPYVTASFRAGASGYVVKRAAAAELVSAIRSVVGGHVYVDPSIGETLVKGYLDQPETARETLVALSVRERDVLIQTSRGFSNKEIAVALRISVKTVETYKGRIAEKLGLRSRADIVRYAMQRGWMQD